MNILKTQRLLNKFSSSNIFGTAKATRYLSYFLFKKPKGKVFCQNLHGFSLWLDPIEDKLGLEFDLYYLGTYEKGTLQVIENYLAANDNFLDIGANIGFISLFAALKCKNGQVHSFEANPNTYAILNANIADNHVKNIVAHGFALGASNGKAKIYPKTLESNRGGASLVESELNQGIDGVDVDVKRFDDLDVSHLPFSMVKIDVEGFEMEVLKGAEHFLKGENAPALIVECSESRSNLNFNRIDLYRYLLSINKYKIYRLKLGKERRSTLVEVKHESEIPFHDNLFCFLPNQLHRIQNIL